MIDSAQTKDELAASLAQDFQAEGISPAFSNEMAQQLIAEYAEFEVQPPQPGTIGLMVGRYAIRKDDVKLFDAVMDGLKAAAGVSFFTAHQPTLTANVAIGISVAKLVRAAVMRGGHARSGQCESPHNITLQCQESQRLRPYYC